MAPSDPSAYGIRPDEPDASSIEERFLKVTRRRQNIHQVTTLLVGGIGVTIFVTIAILAPRIANNYNGSVPTPTVPGSVPPQSQTIGNVTVLDFDQDGRVDAAWAAGQGQLQIIPTKDGQNWAAIIVPTIGTVITAVVAGGFSYAAGRRQGHQDTAAKEAKTE